MQQVLSTIIALATPPGVGAIGVIRLSGPAAITITDQVFKGKVLADQASHTIHFGRIVTAQGEIIDEVVVSLYRNPRSYTGEDIIEISCHGSPYILHAVMDVCITAGAVPAQPGEFTQRAFLNGKMDLTQAEAVADLIASQSRSAQKAAMHNLRGGFSNELKDMREELIHFTALIELELDFSEEDVEFADRSQLYALVGALMQKTDQLMHSFQLGNVVKNGVNVAIVGKPNAGKSTLLNALLNEERAIVSDIAGTTRDTIEEVMNIEGILFRFIDTAGIREHSTDVIEHIGMERSLKKAAEADLVLYVYDVTTHDGSLLAEAISWLKGLDKPYLVLLNKTDAMDVLPEAWSGAAFHHLSAKTGTGVDALKQQLKSRVLSNEVQAEGTLVTNARHYAALQQLAAALADIKEGMDTGLTGDLLTLDIRRALYLIGSITGDIQTDRDILGAIFGKFCIGK